MHTNGSARSNEAESSRSSARTPTGRAATPLPLLSTLQGSVGNAAVVQMLREAGHPWSQDRHRHSTDCGHQQPEQPVQRSTVPEVMSTPSPRSGPPVRNARAPPPPTTRREPCRPYSAREL